jgi:HD-GYP domain-containing protein (c-di-GMP phosphodiesterase class II)
VVGVAKLYKNIFKADTVALICKYFNFSKLLKIRIQDKQPILKRGGLSILTRREKSLLEEDKEVILDNRLISPFIFLETLGGVYIKRKRIPFTDLEKELFITLSEQVTISFKIINLYLEERQILIGYIKALSKLLDQYVPTSYINYRESWKLIRAMGKELKLTEEEIKSLEYASSLHDAGKIHLPQKLLEKEEPLTEDEFRIVMKHPKKGVELIKDLGVLKPVIPIILHHHERYDGKGYPSRLKKEEIPLGSRILAILDAFDAMFFGRPYKKKMSLEEIERELKKQKGIQFDPKVVEAFLKVLKKKNIRKHFSLQT